MHATPGFGEAVSWLGMDEAAPLSSLENYLYDFIKSNLKVLVYTIHYTVSIITLYHNILFQELSS